MALRPYTLRQPVGHLAPMIVDSPHSGNIYPVDFQYTCPQHFLRMIEDSFVDELVAGATDAGASVLAAEFPRSMIDLNRAEDDIDLAVLAEPWPHPLNPSAMTSQGFGLIRRLCRNGIPLYPEPLTVIEVQRRIDTYYRPYHQVLAELITDRMKAFGHCILINAHSMPDRSDKETLWPDFILGDQDGTSCDPAVTATVAAILRGQGYRVALNDPYKGRDIIRRYGLTGLGAQALQIEINRRLYLSEITREKTTGFDQLQENMTKFFHQMADTSRRRTVPENWAAE